MDIQNSPQEIAKKLWNMVRLIVIPTMKKTITDRIITLNLHTLLNTGKLASKAVASLLHHHSARRRRYYAALTCRSDDITATFISPRHYEFSCSNSPAYLKSSKRRSSHQIWRDQYDAIEVSPLPGFGSSPAARELRVTDSPFPLAEENGGQVDRDAEEFIKRFYMDLKNQRRIAALESPSPMHLSGR